MENFTAVTLYFEVPESKYKEYEHIIDTICNEIEPVVANSISIDEMPCKIST